MSSWPAYYLIRADTTDLQEDEVRLLDPTKVWLDPSALITLCGAVGFDDAACEQWSARQYLPLGDERLVVRKIPHAQHLIGQQSTFETLLNGLTAA